MPWIRGSKPGRKKHNSDNSQFTIDPARCSRFESLPIELFLLFLHVANRAGQVEKFGRWQTGITRVVCVSCFKRTALRACIGADLPASANQFTKSSSENCSAAKIYFNLNRLAHIGNITISAPGLDLPGDVLIREPL
jgi:hypothetical protein